MRSSQPVRGYELERETRQPSGKFSETSFELSNPSPGSRECFDTPLATPMLVQLQLWAPPPPCLDLKGWNSVDRPCHLSGSIFWTSKSTKVQQNDFVISSYFFIFSCEGLSFFKNPGHPWSHGLSNNLEWCYGCFLYRSAVKITFICHAKSFCKGGIYG